MKAVVQRGTASRIFRGMRKFPECRRHADGSA